MRTKIIMAMYLALALTAAFNAFITYIGLRDLQKQKLPAGFVRWLFCWFVLASLVFGALAFTGCGGLPEEPETTGCFCPPDYIEWDDNCTCDDPPPPPPYETEPDHD